MRVKVSAIFLFLLLSSFSGMLFISAPASKDTAKSSQPVADSVKSATDTLKMTQFPYYEKNEYCLKCHGNEQYMLVDSASGSQEKRIMCSNYRIDRKSFYQANHKSFACTDCHSEEFMNFPHKVSARMEQMYNCIDCHGGDANFAKYHFEEIQSEYDLSTHAKIEGFSCWKCHNPHTYKITARTSSNILSTIRYDNNICLNCHANFQNFSLLTNREEIDLVKNHGWLPNQVAHFASVRCIECHAAINDTIMVSHLLMLKDSAVRRCTECHSTNSRLMSTLYKFQRKQERKTGFVNGIIINNSYVIAANRNIFLNVASFVLAGILLIVIIVHVYFRIKKSKTKSDV